ncbi:unnamed protein product [Ixodes persulcatus]
MVLMRIVQVLRWWNTVSLVLFFWVTVVSALFIGGLNQNVRLCMLSQASSLQTQCILCNQPKYNSAVNGCTRQNSLASNITIEEAFCILAACIDNPRQTPINLGKRKKRGDDDSSDRVVEEHYAQVIMDDYDVNDDDF